jgi:hypothetical protein
MLRFAKAFWDIALGRSSPAALPASLLLLALVSLTVALLEVVGALLPPASLDGIWLRLAMRVLLPLAFCAAVLLMSRRLQRFLQTGTALLGVVLLAQLVLYPLSELTTLLGGPERLSALLPQIAMLAVLAWNLLGNANIWRAACDAPLSLGLALSVGFFLLSAALEQEYLPTT